MNYNRKHFTYIFGSFFIFCSCFFCRNTSNVVLFIQVYCYTHNIVYLHVKLILYLCLSLAKKYICRIIIIISLISSKRHTPYNLCYSVLYITFRFSSNIYITTGYSSHIYICEDGDEKKKFNNVNVDICMTT